MQPLNFLVRDDISTDVVARLGARDVALWIRPHGTLDVSLSAMANFIGLPWRMIIDENYDKNLVDALQLEQIVDDPLVRRRGFIQVIESDIGKIDLPTRSLPFLLLNGRRSDSIPQTFEDRMRRMAMLEFIRCSSVRQIVVIGGDNATIPNGISEIWGSAFKPSIAVVRADADADADAALRQASAAFNNVTLATCTAAQLVTCVLQRYGEVYPPDRTMVRVRDRRGQFQVVDLTTGDEPERPILGDYELIEERDLRPITPDELPKDALNDFFSGTSARWEPFAAGLPWFRDQTAGVAVRSILSRLNAQGSDTNVVGYITAESGAGGTTLARALAWEAAREGYPVLMAKNVPFQIHALPLANYMKRAKDLIHEASPGRVASNEGIQTEHELYEVPWLVVFDVVHWQHRPAELVSFFHEVRRSGRPVFILVVVGTPLPIAYFNKSIFKTIASLNHLIPTESAKQLGTHLNRFLRSRGLARNEQQWDSFFNSHTVGGRDKFAAFWVTLSFWIRGQYDLAESMQDWIYSKFKLGCANDELKKAVLEIATLSAERVPMPEALLYESTSSWPMSALLTDVKSELGALGLITFDGTSGRHWALAHDVLGKYLLNALYYDQKLLAQLGFGEAKSAEHLQLLLLGQISRKIELGERRYRSLGEDFATTFLKIDPDHGHFSFAPFWREALDILSGMPSPLRDSSRVFRHHTAISRRRIAKLGMSADIGPEEKVRILRHAVSDLRYAMDFIDYAEDSESDLNLLNSLANAYFDLASAQLEAGLVRQESEATRQLGYEAAGRAYALSPANPFVLETHVKSLLERAGENTENAAALCVEALNVLFAASDSKEVQYRRDQLAKMADNALSLLLRQRRSLDGSTKPSGPVDVLVAAWTALSSSFDDYSFFELDVISPEALDEAIAILANPAGAGNAQVLRLTFDLVVRREPHSFDKQLGLLAELTLVGYRLPAQLQLDRAILLYQTGRAPEGDREFAKLRDIWRKSEQYVYVPERLRWLLTGDRKERKLVDSITASGYGARATARIKEFNNALTHYRPEEHGLSDPKPGLRFKAYVSFGINGPFLRPISAPRTHA